MSDSLTLTRFQVHNSTAELIVGDLRFPAGVEKPLPVVMICHSFMAFKDWGWFPFVAESIARAGFATLIFNFSRNGVRENPNRMTDFEAFEKNTISHELHDVESVLEAIQRKNIGEGVIDPASIAFLGHSRGGGLAILTASTMQYVKALVTWSSVATFDRWTVHQKAEWRRLGFLPLSKGTSVSPLRLGTNLLDDVEKNRERLNPVRAAGSVRIPWLLLHGKEDLAVRFSEAEQLYAVSQKATTTFVPLEKVGHLFGGAEVTEESSIHHALKVTIDWLRSHFKELSMRG